MISAEDALVKVAALLKRHREYITNLSVITEFGLGSKAGKLDLLTWLEGDIEDMDIS